MVRQEHQNERPRLGGGGKLYVHVASLLRRKIREGIWQAGSQLPTLDDLSQEHAVSIITIRQAVMLLEQEGLLQRVQGKGTFVTGTAAAREWLRLGTTWDDILSFYDAAQQRLSIKNLHIGAHQTLPVNLLAQEGTVVSKSFRYLRRLHSLEGTPYALSHVYIDEPIFRRWPKAFEKGLALKVLDDMAAEVIVAAKQLLRITSSDSEMSTYLDIPIGMPMAEIQRTILDQSNKIIYVSVMHYRGDLIQVESRLK